jgi:hypothetical protein
MNTCWLVRDTKDSKNFNKKEPNLTRGPMIGIARGTLAEAALMSKTSPFYFNFVFFFRVCPVLIFYPPAHCAHFPNLITSTLSRVRQLEVKVLITLPVEDHHAAFTIAFAIVRHVQRGICIAANYGR